jgi:hypothetical protein
MPMFQLLDVEKNLQERTTLEDASMIAQETEPMLESKVSIFSEPLHRANSCTFREIMQSLIWHLHVSAAGC